MAQGAAQQMVPIGVLTDVTRNGSLASNKNAVVSEAYMGMVVCADCGGIRVELSLYREGGNAGGGTTPSPAQVRPSSYHLRQTFFRNFNENVVVDSNGTWREFVDERHPGVLVELLNRDPNELRFMARAAKNEGTLVLLDGQLNELAADVPHMLVEVSGERQEHLTLLTEADNGRTVEMQPGEIFLVRLRNETKAGEANSGYMWTSNRPRSMALVETGGAEGPQPAPIVIGGAAALGASTSSSANRVGGGTSRRGAAPSRQVMVQNAENYSVWEMIAPSQGTQELRFEYRSLTRAQELPVRVVTLSLVVH